MLIKVIWENEYVVVVQSGAQVKVKSGEVFETHPEHGNSYLVNYPNIFQEHSWYEAPKVQEEDDVQLQKQKATEIREQIKALGKNPIPWNDIDKLQAQLDKYLAEKAEADATETAKADATTEATTGENESAPATVEAKTETAIADSTADATASDTTITQ